MKSLHDLANTYKKKIEALNSDRELFAHIVAKDVIALVSNRVQNKGVNADDKKFTPYSQKPMPFYLLNPSKFKSKNKIERFKKIAANEVKKAKKDNRAPDPVKLSYFNLRKTYGLTTNKNFTFSGAMFSSIITVTGSRGKDFVVVEIRAKDDFNQMLLNVHSGREKISLLAMNNKETGIINNTIRSRIKKILNE